MVEEAEYRSTYNALNQRRCNFEKAVLTHRCACLYSNRFYLADREGISCDSADVGECCGHFLRILRSKARFALGISIIDQPLPHAKEIRVQNGGLLGLQRVLHSESGCTEKIGDIAGLIKLAEQNYGSMERLPYQEIVKTIVRFEGRRRPRSRR